MGQGVLTALVNNQYTENIIQYINKQVKLPTYDVHDQCGEAEQQVQGHEGQQGALEQLVGGPLVPGVEAQQVRAQDQRQRRVAVAVAVYEERR